MNKSSNLIWHWLQAVMRAVAMVCLGTLLGVPAAMSQEFPSKPIKLVVTYAAGGSTDIPARLIAIEMSRQLGQSVIIENKAGANGSIGANFVARSVPDGYTLCYCTTGPMVILPLIDSKLPYNPSKDFVPVTHVLNQSFAVVVRSDLNINSLQDLVRYAKANPGKFTYASPGAATPMSLTAELLANTAGVNFTAIPYRGDQLALMALISGEIEGMALATALVRNAIASGKVKVLAVSSSTRLKDMPNVPTIAELGFADFQTNNLHAILAPAGTPQPVIDRLHSAIAAVLQSTEMQERLVSESLSPVGAGPAAVKVTLAEEAVRWQRAIRITNLQTQ